MQWYCVWEEGTCNGTVCGRRGHAVVLCVGRRGHAVVLCVGRRGHAVVLCAGRRGHAVVLCVLLHTVHTCIRTYTITHTRTYIYLYMQCMQFIYAVHITRG